MSTTIVMQDWVTVQGSSGSTVVVQPESQWIDLGLFQDLTTYIEVADFVTASAEVAVQSAPVKEGDYFATLANVVGSVGIFVSKVPWAGASTAPSRWLRWSCLARDPDWSITFRITLNLNPAG